MRRSLLLPLIAVAGLLAAGCVMPPPDAEPQLCQPGTFSATGEAPCTPAPVGTFVAIEGATQATDCPVGKYQDEEGQVLCKDAQPGTFVDVEGAASATLCPLGRYQPNSGSTSCLLAPIGTYVDFAGAIAPTDCPPGTTTEFTGSVSESDCVEVLLAVAYSNLDGLDGYDPGAGDVLIAKLVDTDLDGAVSVGDTVVTNQYPLDFATSGFGDFQSTSHAVATVNLDTTEYANVDDAAGNRFGFSAPAGLEQYIEYAGGATKAVFTDVLNTATERVRADVDAPSMPDAPVSLSRVGLPADEQFIDVDILLEAG